MSESNIMAYVNSRSPLSGLLIASNFSSVLFFSRIFTWIALGDINLRVLLALVRKRNTVEEETR